MTAKGGDQDARLELAPTWIRSSLCAHGDCVEVSYADRCVIVRDSKLGPEAPVQVWTPEAWKDLLYAVEFLRPHPGVLLVDGDKMRLGVDHEFLWFDLHSEWIPFRRGVQAGEFDVDRLTARALAWHAGTAGSTSPGSGHEAAAGAQPLEGDELPAPVAAGPGGGQTGSGENLWYAMHDHGDGYGAHQHFPENQTPGHSHANVPLVARSEDVPAGRVSPMRSESSAANSLTGQPGPTPVAQLEISDEAVDRAAERLKLVLGSHGARANDLHFHRWAREVLDAYLVIPASRVWALAEEPDRDVYQILDVEGYIWLRQLSSDGPDFDSWHPSDDPEHCIPWLDLLIDYGPLTEVIDDGAE